MTTQAFSLREAAAALRVSWPVFEKALYHAAVRDQLSRTYRKQWGHPRRRRVLTPADLAHLAAWFSSRGPFPRCAPSARASSG